jgi:RNA polymerase sigma-70 factor (ECF subfamily)
VDRTELSGQLAEQVPGLLRYARSITSDPRRAEDLVQDTLVRGLERCASFRGESSLATWLHRILHNLAVDQARRSREVPADLSDDEAADRVDARWSDDSYTVDSALVLERAETAEKLQDALLRMPLIYRSTVVLHDEEGLTMSDVAQIQDIGLSAAKQRLRRGRMMLVSELAADRSPAASPGVPMRCWDARHRVSEYMDEGLTPRDRSLLEAHLEGCPMCPPLYAGLVGARDALNARRDSDAVIPSDLAARIVRSAAGPDCS